MGIQPALTTSMNIKVSWSGKVDVDVVRRVVGPVPGQFDPLAADFQGRPRPVRPERAAQPGRGGCRVGRCLECGSRMRYR